MKISTQNLKKIMEVCTKKEIDLIIYIGQFQDEYGMVSGINYKDVLENIDISKSTFYKLLYSLEAKQIIEINYINEYAFWEITFINNIFATKEDYKKGYLKLNYQILHTKEFKKLTKSEKLIVLHLITINDFRREKIKITIKKMALWTGKSIRSVKKFIQTLSKLLNIVVQENICFIDCLFGFGTRAVSETDVKHTHIINYKLKKAKSKATDKDIKDVCTMLKQFANIGINNILKIVDDTILTFGTIIPAYINKMITISNRSTLC